MGPAALRAEPDRDHQGGSTGLRVFWSRSAGQVDWYGVTLEEGVSGFTRSTRVTGAAAPQARFGSLVPGIRYTLSVVASSGGKNSTSVRTSAATGEWRTSVWTGTASSFNPPHHLARHPAPAPVRRLQVASSSSGSLAVSWQAGWGRTERVWTLLTDREGVVLKNISLQNAATSVLLDQLQPAATYTVTVVTEAAGLQSSASIQAVTGKYGASCGLGRVQSVYCSDFSAGSGVRTEAGPQRQLTQSPGLLAPC